MKRSISLGLAAGAMAVALMSASGASAQTTIVDGTFKRLLGFGEPDEAPAINYSERAPIVMPKNNALPSPTTDQAAENPAWPKDPDAQKARKQKTTRNGMPAGNSSYVPQAKMNERGEVVRGDDDGMSSGYATLAEKQRMRPLSPRDMQKRVRSPDDEAPVRLGAEPPRRSLIDPPAGMRTPVATAPIAGDEPLPSQGDRPTLPWYKRWMAPADD